MKVFMMCLEILWFGLRISTAIAVVVVMVVLACLHQDFMEEYCAMEWSRIDAEQALYEQREAEASQSKEEAHQAHLQELKQLKEIREEWARESVLPPPGTIVQPSGP